MMSLIRRCADEVLALFVDDTAQSVLVIGWIAVAWAAGRHLAVGPWSGPLLFLGVAVIFAGDLLSRR